MLALLLFGLLPFAFSGIFDDGADDATLDEADTGDDTLPGGSPGGLDPLVPGDGGGGGGTSGGGNSGGGVQDTYDELQHGTDANDSLTGGSRSDLLIGEGGDDSLSGGLQGDLLFGLAGADFLKGEAGDDTLSGGAGNDTIWGLEDDDVLSGNGGDDLLQGGGGADTLIDFSGRDTLKGGTGADELIALDLSDKISGEDAMVRTGDINLSDGFFRQDILTDFGRDPDYRDGDDLALSQELSGAERTENTADVLEGGAGDDTLLGDNGDTLTGGAGSDIFIAYTDPRASQPNAPVIITDFNPDADRLQFLVEDNGKGELTMQAAADGTGTELFYRDTVVALILGKTPDDLGLLLGSVVTRTDV